MSEISKEQMLHRLKVLRIYCRGNHFECGACKLDVECDAIEALIESSVKITTVGGGLFSHYPQGRAKQTEGSESSGGQPAPPTDEEGARIDEQLRAGGGDKPGGLNGGSSPAEDKAIPHSPPGSAQPATPDEEVSCSRCGGSGYARGGEEKQISCRTCSGSGIVLRQPTPPAPPQPKEPICVWYRRYLDNCPLRSGNCPEEPASPEEIKERGLAVCKDYLISAPPAKEVLLTDEDVRKYLDEVPRTPDLERIKQLMIYVAHWTIWIDRTKSPWTEQDQAAFKEVLNILWSQRPRPATEMHNNTSRVSVQKPVTDALRGWRAVLVERGLWHEWDERCYQDILSPPKASVDTKDVNDLLIMLIDCGPLWYRGKMPEDGKAISIIFDWLRSLGIRVVEPSKAAEGKPEGGGE